MPSFECFLPFIFNFQQLKACKSGGNDALVAVPEEKKVSGPRHMLRYTGPINRALVEQGVKRTSNLLAPIMLLEGHDGEIYCGKEAFIIFKPLGKSSKFHQRFSKTI